MKKVSIKPGCISCGTCAFIAPEVFEIKVNSTVKPDAPIAEMHEKILKAVASCPVQVIAYEDIENEPK